MSDGARDRCAECAPGQLIHGHDRRLLGLEAREGAAVAETRATRDDLRSLRHEMGDWFRSLTGHIMEQSKRIDELEEQLAQLTEAVCAAE